MKLSTLVLFCASSLASASALAQWQWLDAQGRKVYSDLPPSNQVPADRILQRPGTARNPVPAAPSASTQPAQQPDGRGVDRELQARKAAEDAEQARREQAQAHEQDKRQALLRQDNCARARAALAALADGQLVAHTNALGERVYMDDQRRAQERQRAQGMVASDCGPAPSTQPASAQPAPAQPAALQPGAVNPPAASRRDPTPPGASGAGLPRPGRPDEPAVPTVQ